MKKIVTFLAMGAMAAVASAAPMAVTQHAATVDGLDGFISATDDLNGLIGTALEGDTGWHPANTNPADQDAALTDGTGMGGSGLSGLLNDFPPPNAPTKVVAYDMTGTDSAAMGVDIINILSGNNNEDGRIFSTTVIEYSTDGGAFYNLVGYFQSDPSGTINVAGNPASIGQKSTLVTISDPDGPLIPAGVTNIKFQFYAADNTQGQARDPFAGVNPYTLVDDGLSAPIASPLILEVDVLPVPEPASLSLLAIGALALLRRR